MEIKSEGKPIKKQKVKVEEVPFRAGIFSSDKVKEFSDIYECNKPYPHLRIDDFCDSDFLKRVRDEIITNLKADLKESDIFKVYQTKDLKSFGDQDNVPNLLMLRDALFSESFRTFVESITQCPILSPMVDCSCNLYAQGGHLLCHDDFISTRCISYIIYLTDPDEVWIPEHGGAFEMYAFDEETREVSGIPCKSYMPIWNSITFFKVEPGLSYHAIQEIFTDRDNRLSISGWYHYLEPPQVLDEAQSSVRPLQLKKPINFFTTLDQHAIVYEVPGEFLEDGDFKVLAKYINPLYLEKMEVHRIYKKFAEEGSIQLHNFLLKDYFEELLIKAQTSDALDGFDQQCFRGYESGCRAGWKAIGPPQVRRYLTFEKTLADQTDEKDTFGEKLYDLCENFFTTTALAKLLYFLTGCVPETVSTQIQKFRPGSDYTLAQLESKFEGDTLDVVYTIIDDNTEEKSLQWQSGEIGGFEAYVLPDSENEMPPDVYGMDDEDGVLSVNPVSNSLNIVLRDEPLLRFFKYVSTAAPGTRCNVSAEYKLSV